MTKEQAIERLQGLLYYWKDIQMCHNESEQDAVEFAIDYMLEN